MLKNAFMGLLKCFYIFGGVTLLSRSGIYKIISLQQFGVSEIFCGPLMCWYYWSCWPVKQKVKIEPFQAMMLLLSLGYDQGGNSGNSRVLSDPRVSLVRDILKVSFVYCV